MIVFNIIITIPIIIITIISVFMPTITIVILRLKLNV